MSLPPEAPLAGGADLHTHSTASDGLLPPAAVVDAAIAAGLDAIALTDHDTTEGLAEARQAAGDALEVVPGIEMSANVEEAEVHILGYFIDETSTVLSEALATFREQRVRRMERFARRLTELGLPIAMERVRAIAGSGSMGRPHVARAMVEQGYVASVAEAFDHYLAAGRPAFIPRDDVTPAQCVRLVRAAGGVPVLAHPLTTGDPAGYVERLLPEGLLGIEVEYGKYGPEERAGLRALANRFDLVATGGSDYHGPEHRSEARLGGGCVPLTVVEALRRLAQP